jgi:hypothetical protein
MIKRTNAADNWILLDVMRGFDTTADSVLSANLNSAEYSTAAPDVVPIATGFQPRQSTSNVNASGGTYIYIAIRRGPMKTPTSGTSVFSPVTYTGTGASRTVTAGFPVDLSINGNRGTATIGQFFFDRLRGATISLTSATTAAEATDTTSLTSFASNTAVTLGTSASGWVNDSGRTYIDWMFGRAPGFFDVVCYTGATGTNRAISHNLGVAPELIIVKARNFASGWWMTFVSSLGANKYIVLQKTDAVATGAVFPTSPKASNFYVNSTFNDVNDPAYNYVAYLFATCAGVSKVGSYTGTAALQTVNCGFAAGARFVLIKRTDSTGDWYVWDSARGISSGNDPYLLLNSTAAEVTGTNYVDTTAVGFQVTAAAPAAINASGGSFIFLAVA